MTTKAKDIKSTENSNTPEFNFRRYVVFLIGFCLFAIAGFMFFWPTADPELGFSDKFFKLFYSIPVEIRFFIIAALAGALGGCLSLGFIDVWFHQFDISTLGRGSSSITSKIISKIIMQPLEALGFFRLQRFIYTLLYLLRWSIKGSTFATVAYLCVRGVWPVEGPLDLNPAWVIVGCLTIGLIGDQIQQLSAWVIENLYELLLIQIRKLDNQ